MFAYYVEWHRHRSLAPLCSSTTKFPAERCAPRLWRLPARSAQARAEAGKKRTEEGFPVHSFRMLLAEIWSP